MSEHFIPEVQISFFGSGNFFFSYFRIRKILSSNFLTHPSLQPFGILCHHRRQCILHRSHRSRFSDPKIFSSHIFGSNKFFLTVFLLDASEYQSTSFPNTGAPTFDQKSCLFPFFPDPESFSSHSFGSKKFFSVKFNASRINKHSASWQSTI